MENIDQSKIENFRQMINFAKSSAKQNRCSLYEELNRINKIVDSCLSPLSYAETGIVLDMIWRARHS
ncbi:hypothetical protein [Lactobacillus taiwanensis]|uniref:Uncharacterized protein n=1 Tax=Lactobacillus taiwanensis TaxID=508451 RepID=A0A256LA71_9LACO|nr:hypothetical protein [Lactobacillus taiwanensis]OYR87162.1 hypothetical protein CBF53_09235 [Lactobacillus taiwanensis]OYR90033.1 hypothetical protein CBF70_10295 [Lactobacillus taiwanensis]OYR92443.1 hypothetical protein CBF59_03870 [Lactobacillus taiwanensis]OYR95335.1 hypothetical protein CBF58_07365 [Lactobacillus taiwanensis]